MVSSEETWELLCGHGIKNFTIWENGDFGPCFQNLAFGCLPQFFVAVTSAYHAGRHQHRRLRGIIPRSLTLHIRLFITLLLALAPVVLLFLIYLYELLRPGIIDLETYLFQFISWLAHGGFIWRLHRLRHLHIRGTPGTVCSFLFSLLCTIARLRSVILYRMGNNDHWAMTKSEEYTTYSVMGLHVLYLFTLIPYRFPQVSSGILNVQENFATLSTESHDTLLRISGARHVAEEDLSHRTAEDGSGIFSRISFSWIHPILKRGSRGLLSTVDDLFKLPKRIQSDVVKKYFSNHLTVGGDIHASAEQQAGTPEYLPIPDYLSYSGDNGLASSYAEPPDHVILSANSYSTQNDPDLQHISLLKALHKAFGWEYYLLGFLKIICDALTFLGPILLNWLVNYVENPTEEEWHGYVYAAMLFLSTFLAAILSTNFNYMVQVVSFKVKAAVITTIYKKSTSVSSVNMAAFSSGEILNFMSVDTDRVVNYCNSFHQLWSLPVQVGVALYLLYREVGIAFLAGVGFAVLLVPVNKWLANKIGDLSQSLMSSKDARIKMLSEVVYGIRIVKFYTWESHFLRKITSLRDRELVSLKWRKYLDACCVFFWATTPVLISLLTFITYLAALHEKLTAAKVFTCIAVFNLLITPLNAFPWVLNGIVEAWISLKRIQRFLNLPDLYWSKYYEPSCQSSQHGQAAGSTTVVHTGASSAFRSEDYFDTLSTNSDTGPGENSVQSPAGTVLPQNNTSTANYFSPANANRNNASARAAENSRTKVAIEIRDGCFSWDCCESEQKKSEEIEENSNYNDSVFLDSTAENALINSTSIQTTETVTSRIETLKLSNINLSICKGHLVGVIGKVGSGKSSLLAAIAGEIRRESGGIFVSQVATEGLGFVTQESWIQHATIRDNILFGASFNRQRYDSVLEACALVPDLRILPAADLTEVGENGVTLSGGQKARISLARAVYQDKSIYLLDDPFSAVDVHVGQHLFDQCIRGLLRNKTRIIATNHTKFLANADLIVVLDQGRIIASGPPSELQSYISAQSSNTDSDTDSACQSMSHDQSSQPISDQIGGAMLPDDVTQGLLVSNEEKETGMVKLSVYKSYWKATGHCLAVIVLLSLILMQATKNIVDWWLSYWINHSHQNSSITTNLDSSDFNVLLPLLPHPLYRASIALSDVTSSWQNHTDTDDNVKFYLTIYGALAGANSLFTLIRAFSFAYAGLVAATVIHSRLLQSVLHAAVEFFDRTPVGRIINRFSSDVYSVDDSLPFVLNIFLAQTFSVIGSVVICCYALPLVILLLLPLTLAYYLIQRYYRRTSRELKRISSITLSPIYAHFSESISGIVTIRAFRSLNRFAAENVLRLENNQRATFASAAVSQWLNLRIQLIGVLLVASVAAVAIVQHKFRAVEAGLVGLAISYALSVTGQLSGLVVYLTETEKEMIGVERTTEYIDLATEEEENSFSSAFSADEIARVTPDWPSQGVITFDRVCMTYRVGLPDVLCDLTFKTRAGEKIGIVGRTGAGKSSLFLALFRIVNIYDGQIIIDDIDITRTSLQDYRSRLAIIPQDPFLFSGSLKENVDPCCLHSEDTVVEALERCHLGEVLRRLGGVGGEVAERGRHLSVGQRQLVCLARALLSNAKILCIDEATSSIDMETDRLLQETIRRYFRDRTVLTIAHRVQTVSNSDRVMVISNGRVAEFDSPRTLLNNPQSLFYSLYHNS